MRWLSPVGLLLLTACGASQVEQTQLKDGSWQFTCQLSMDECLRRVQDQCKNQRFRILEGTSETRLRDAPPFEHAYHTSRVHLTCTSDGSDVLITVGGDAPAKAGEKPAAKCSVGETRACVGPGACQGGQACLANGSGFGSCDCGPSAATTAAPASSEPVAPTEPVPGAAAPGTAVPPAPAAPAPR